MVYVFLADGFEEIEALTAVDLLRRVNVEVKTVAIGNSSVVRGAHNIKVNADLTEKETALNGGLDCVVLPGGMPGAENLLNSDTVKKALAFCNDNNKRIAAICAAPMVLGKKGLLKGKSATCYPGFEKYLDGATVKNEKVVTDGNITTACGPGAATEFALELVSLLTDGDTRKRLEGNLLCRR